MPLSLNEIRERARAFAKEWAGETSERAEAQSFWNGSFNVIGVNRRRIVENLQDELEAFRRWRMSWLREGESEKWASDKQE